MNSHPKFLLWGCHLIFAFAVKWVGPGKGKSHWPKIGMKQEELSWAGLHSPLCSPYRGVEDCIPGGGILGSRAGKTKRGPHLRKQDKILIDKRLGFLWDSHTTQVSPLYIAHHAAGPSITTGPIHGSVTLSSQNTGAKYQYSKSLSMLELLTYLSQVPQSQAKGRGMNMGVPHEDCM